MQNLTIFSPLEGSTYMCPTRFIGQLAMFTGDLAVQKVKTALALWPPVSELHQIHGKTVLFFSLVVVG